MKAMQDEPFTMLGISLDHTREQLALAVERDSLSWPIIYDGWDQTYPIAEEWAIGLLGTNFLIDQDGIIKQKLIFGRKLDQALKRLLRKLDQSTEGIEIGNIR
ncbi:peroxiredoxin family protein [Gemmatimonadota bacterium]